MKKTLLFGVSLWLVMYAAAAGQVDVVAAEFIKSADTWTVHVTLKHDDTGWDHYADMWRIVGADGKEYGTRVLYHPHEEQPFTRSLIGVVIPEDVKIVYVEGHDKVHGWAEKRLQVDLSREAGEGYKVRR